MLAETAYAKINLALHVRARRADGYHALESLFAFAEDGDRLEGRVREDGSLTLSIDGPFAQGLSSGPDNLVLRAAEALKNRHGASLGAELRLTKNLPVASGIGGGSADAAAALRLLVRLWGISDPDLLSLAATLGSDVPACLVSRTLMGTGRGEALDLRDIPGLGQTPLLLVNPGKPLATAPVFAGWDGQDGGPLVADSLEEIIARGRNDLEAPAIALVPEIADVLNALRQRQGVLLARMSGSGASCFALMESEAALDAAGEALARAHPGWWIMKSRLRCQPPCSPADEDARTET